MWQRIVFAPIWNSNWWPTIAYHRFTSNPRTINRYFVHEPYDCAMKIIVIYRENRIDVKIHGRSCFLFDNVFSIIYERKLNFYFTFNFVRYRWTWIGSFWTFERANGIFNSASSNRFCSIVNIELRSHAVQLCVQVVRIFFCRTTRTRFW